MTQLKRGYYFSMVRKEKNEEICDVCYKEKKLRWRIFIPDGYLEVCSKKCGVEELKRWIPQMMEKIE